MLRIRVWLLLSLLPILSRASGHANPSPESSSRHDAQLMPFIIPGSGLSEDKKKHLCIESLLSKEGRVYGGAIEIVSLDTVASLVHVGERHFRLKLKGFGLEPAQKNTSQVHEYNEIYGQAFLLALSSLPHPDEITWKSEITFMSHWWDDLVDRPDGISYARLEQFVRNPADLRGAAGREIAFLWEYINRSPNPNSTLRAIVRLTYGGLIQRAPTREIQEKYLKEYREYSLRGVEPDVQRTLREMSPVIFWMTTKTVFELMLQPDLEDRPTLTVLLDCLFGAAIFYHDAREEALTGELKALKGQIPLATMQARFIKILSGYLVKYELDSAPLRVEQLRYTLVYVGDRLPKTVARAYEYVLQSWGYISQLIARKYLDPQVAQLSAYRKKDILKALEKASRGY